MRRVRRMPDEEIEGGFTGGSPLDPFCGLYGTQL